MHHPRFRRPAGLLLAALLPLLLLTACGKKTPPKNTTFNDRDRALLAQYDAIRANLADDDLRGVRRSASKLVTALEGTDPSKAPTLPSSPLLAPAKAIADAKALDSARAAFKTMSAEAIRLTSGVDGFHVLNCPMTPDGDWVQTSTKIDNPFMGKIMRDCGTVKY